MPDNKSSRLNHPATLTGDVKYHLGVAGTLEVTPEPGSGPREVRLSIAPNPSHLEAVAPVVLGMVRAEQAALNAEGPGQCVSAEENCVRSASCAC